MNEPVKLRANDSLPRSLTYSAMMLDALLKGDRFTGPEAFQRWGVWSVGSLINNLRSKGWQIDSDREEFTGRAIYYIERRRQLKGRRYYPFYRVAL